MMIVIDGTGAIIGRASARIAKMLLKGEEVSLVNADKMLMSGNIAQLTGKYMARRRAKNKMNPENSPKWPRVPDMLVRRIIRGMLPWDSMRGRTAFRRLRVYSGVPGKLASEKAIQLEGVSGAKIEKKVTMKVLCARLGYAG